MVAWPHAWLANVAREAIARTKNCFRRISPRIPRWMDRADELYNLARRKLVIEITETSAPHQEPDDGSRHEVGHGSGHHGAQTKLGEHVTLVRRQGSNPADLNT